MNVLNAILEHKIFYLLLLVVVLTNVVCIIYLVIKERKQDRKEIESLMDDLKTSKPRKKEEPKEEIKEKEVVKEDVEMDNTGKLEIEKVLEKMQKDLEATPEEVISTFEQDQEDKSIISYQELLDTMKRVTPKEEVKEEKIVPIEEIKEQDDMIVDVIDVEEDKDLEVNQIESVKGYEQKDFKTETKEVLIGKSKEESYKKKEFKNTEIISPIFGKVKNVEEEYPKVPLISREEELVELLEELPQRSDKYEGSLDVGPLAEEMRKNDEFLRSLKEFRNSL